MIREPVQPAQSDRIVDRVLAWLDQAGHADAYPEVRAARAQARTQLALARDAATDPRRVLATVVGRVLDDEDDTDAGVAAERLAVARANADGAEEVARAAVAEANSRAWRALVGPEIITTFLRPVVETKAALATELVEVIPRGVVDDRSAVAASPEAAAAWSALITVAADMDAAWDIAEMATSTGLTGERLPNFNDLALTETQRRNPWNGRNAVRQRYGTAVPHRNVGLIEDVEFDRDPTCLLLSEAIDLRLSRDGIRTAEIDGGLFAVDPDGKPYA